MIIAISGKKGSGKDTVGGIIQRRQPEKDWQIKKYAGKLKEVAGLMLGIKDLSLFEKEDFKNSKLGEEWSYVEEYFNELGRKVGEVNQTMTVRTFLQRLGTEGGRAVHPEIWINALYSNYIPLTYSDRGGYEYPNWIITDARFPNEIKAIKDRGGVIIRLERDDMLRLGKEDTDKHPSETALDDYKDWDALITNNGTEQELIEEVTNILKSMYNAKAKE